MLAGVVVLVADIGQIKWINAECRADQWQPVGDPGGRDTAVQGGVVDVLQAEQCRCL